MPVLLIFNLQFNHKTEGFFSITRSLNVNDSSFKQATVWSQWSDVTILITLRHDDYCHVHRRAFENKKTATNEPRHKISNNVICATSKDSDQPVHTVWSEPLLVAWIFYACYAADWTSFGVSKLKRRLHRLVWVYSFQIATFLEITCRCSN